MNSVSMMDIISKNKKIGLVYCRLSRIPDSKYGVLSLDSQEHAINECMTSHGITIFKCLKSVGSAFKLPQNDLRDMLKGCKNKVLYVYEANRLSRNVRNFDEIWKICHKNKIHIFIANLKQLFRSDRLCDKQILLKLIEQAEKESRDMGARISRTYRYKKSKELEWGKMYKDGLVVDCDFELKTSMLIKLLNTPGSSVLDIYKLIKEVGKTEGKDPFEIVMYDRTGKEEVVSKLPFSMSLGQIEKTLQIYEVKKRSRKWHKTDIVAVLNSNSVKPVDNFDTLCNDFTGAVSTRQEVKVEDSSKEQEWIGIWYDPDIGLPPHVKLPEGMQLPTIKTTLYIPKI